MAVRLFGVKMKLKLIEVYIQVHRDTDILTGKVRHQTNHGTVYGSNLIRAAELVSTDSNKALHLITQTLHEKTEKIRFVFEPYMKRPPLTITT